MLHNTATSINSNNNKNRNHRITVILASCKLCILHFLTPSRWKMHIKVRCVFQEYQILKKLHRNLIKTMIKFITTILILSWCKLCIFVNLFMFLWNFEQAFGWRPERKSLWSKYIGEICVMVVYIKIIFLYLILNWRSLCKLSRDATYRRK